MVTSKWSSFSSSLLLASLSLLFLSNAKGEEILFFDDFQSGQISEEWTYFGDPNSIINQSEGNPAPSFNNNGDTMWNSGIKSRRTFSIKNGLVIQCDIFLSCHPRGAWVATNFGLEDPSLTSGNTEPRIIIGLEYGFLGELNWARPHLEGTLTCSLAKPYRSETIPPQIHMNQWLDGWHTFRLEVSPTGLCSYLIDDSLIFAQQAVFPDSLDEVGVFLTGRATSWGIALHDNLVVSVP